MKFSLKRIPGRLLSFLNPSWEKEILLEVYKKYNSGLLILAYMAVVGQSYFSFYDFHSGHNYNASLRFINLLICILYIYYFNRIDINSKIDWHLFVITSFYLCEVEVELYSFDDPYYELSTWLMIPLLMLYHAFYFKNIPQKYVLFWFVLLAYYYIRASLSSVANFTSPELLGVIMYFIPSFIISSLFNYLWTENRYTNQLYLRNLEGEIAKRIEIEKELAIQSAKENMVDDLHDHLGSAILDMKWKILELLNELPQNSEGREKIQHSLYQIEDALRLNINSLIDIKYIREDFFEGIRVILFRRYEIFKRQTQMNFDHLESSQYISLRDPNFLQELYQICMSICSIDLKYGKGISIWNCLCNDELRLEFETQIQKNNGEIISKLNHIKNFVELIKGTYNYTIGNQTLACNIHIPLNNI